MLVASFLAAFAPLTAQAPVLDPAEVAAWREDLGFLCREMEARHKNLYHAISREDFAARRDALERKLPELARHEVIVALAQLVAAVGDGHTNLYPTRDARVGFHELPVAFTLFE